MVNSAIGGSTNAPIHINALARHIGVELSIDDWQKHGHEQLARAGIDHALADAEQQPQREQLTKLLASPEAMVASDQVATPTINTLWTSRRSAMRPATICMGA